MYTLFNQLKGNNQKASLNWYIKNALLIFVWLIANYLQKDFGDFWFPIPIYWYVGNAMYDFVKGQEISEWKYEDIALPKIWAKKFEKFCPDT